MDNTMIREFYLLGICMKMTIRCDNGLGETTIQEFDGSGNWFQESVKGVSCPFTWDMGIITETREKLWDDKNRIEEVIDIQEEFPEFVLIYNLMLAYENVLNKNLQTAMKCIKEAEDSFHEIKQRKIPESAEHVLQHILFGTKYHVLQQLGQVTQADELLKEISIVKDMNETELAMLSGCQCLAWSLYHVTDHSMAINSARKAVQHEPSNGKWHFLLGKMYRRSRRRHYWVGNHPDKDESLAFQKAYDLSKSALFGVSLAQMYRESGEYSEATRSYKEIAAGEPTSCKVQLQLALGLIRAKECSHAKGCLDYVAKKTPNSSIYQHYMGIYEEKCHQNFKAALSHYTAAIKESNFAAEWSYIECKKKVETHWNPLPYLLELLKKYSKDPDYQIQQITVEIGLYYLFHTDDILSASQYLDKAVQIDPNAQILKAYHVPRGNQMNVYHAWAVRLHLALLTQATKLSIGDTAMLKNKLQLCSENDQDSSSISGDSKQTLSQQWSNIYKNYHRRSSASSTQKNHLSRNSGKSKKSQYQFYQRNKSKSTRQPKHLS
ncbi:uncharacterized protein LOC124404695 [Diprion similis]|uniref:uncharacterized protein LOC124404695 n=1 Tax=Diprion similis TaxID=362088 RepID=UPI001EF91FDE|nr:uncharacterized protein LOC124404695 [Diprion similis]